jgi:hypothetical protein
MVFGLGRRKAAAPDAADSVEGPAGLDIDGMRRGVSTGAEAGLGGGASPDEIDAQFGRSYPPDILDELRTYDRPAWREEDSSLDPVDDLSDYFKHDFSLPPPVYDAAQRSAQAQIDALEGLRAPLHPDFRDGVEHRQRLVQVCEVPPTPQPGCRAACCSSGRVGRAGLQPLAHAWSAMRAPRAPRPRHHSAHTAAPPLRKPASRCLSPSLLISSQNRPAEDIQWLKLKAYHRGMQQLRATREDDAHEERQDYLAAKVGRAGGSGRCHQRPARQQPGSQHPVQEGGR